MGKPDTVRAILNNRTGKGLMLVDFFQRPFYLAKIIARKHTYFRVTVDRGQKQIFSLAVRVTLLIFKFAWRISSSAFSATSRPGVFAVR
jgi:hypothetical protein